MVINFGTDGWRGIIAREYTFDKVRACAQGVANYLLGNGLGEQGLVVGYDTRFASEDFAAQVAEVVAGNGVNTYLCDRAAPTPVVSYNAFTRSAAGSVIITASHNPGQWNGFKYKPATAEGAQADVEIILEREANEALASGNIKSIEIRDAQAQGLLSHINPAPAYLRHVASIVDLESIRSSGLRVVVDSMHGAGGGYHEALLSGGLTECFEIRSDRNPSFPGMVQPEPTAHNLEPLSDSVRATSAHVGLALDGDADRLGVMDENGKVITPLQVFSLLVLYLLEMRGERGPLVKSITMSGMIFRLAELYDVPVLETPVGFKHLAKVMMEEKALAAGEESGGFAFRNHIPERDGVFSGLLFLEMMVKAGKTPSELVQYLYSRVGPQYYRRLDIGFSPNDRQRIERIIDEKIASLGMVGEIQSVDRMDGHRITFKDGAWLATRFSGTEPLLRVYAEAPKEGQEAKLLEDFRSLLTQVLD